MRYVVAVAMLSLILVSITTSPDRAFACSGGGFELAAAAGYLQEADVIAVGTLRGVEGATIGLDVEAYYKAPEGATPHLVLNNLEQALAPDCTSSPLRMRRYEEGRRVAAILQADEQGSGGHWRGSLVQGSGVLYLEDSIPPGDVTFADFDAALASAGAAATKPNATTPAERPLVPASPLTCIFDRWTIASLAEESEIAGIAVPLKWTPEVITYQIDEPAKGGPGPLTVTVNNHRFSGGLKACAETVAEAPRIRDDGSHVFLFLKRDASGTGADWRPSGIDAKGLFLEHDIPWPNASGSAVLSFDEVAAAVRSGEGAPSAPHPPSVGSGLGAPESEGRDWTFAAVASVLGVVMFRLAQRNRSRS